LPPSPTSSRLPGAGSQKAFEAGRTLNALALSYHPSWSESRNRKSSRHLLTSGKNEADPLPAIESCSQHKDEIGRQMRSEYELPRELPNELSALLNNLLALPRRARFLNEGVKEILVANGGIQHVNTSCF
jgi:hypothetical protein